MTESIALIVLGIVLLVAGGEILLRGAVSLATLLKLTPAVIGLTVVAAGTSVPELAVSGIAAFQGKTDIAVANVVGSNIFNIAVIIGLCALLRPVPITGNTIKLEYPVLALVTFLCIGVVQDGVVDQIDALLFLACYVGFTAYLVRLVQGQVTSTEKLEFDQELQELETPGIKPTFMRSSLLILGGIILLGAGAQATVAGAVDMARSIGWSERLIGLTIVSAGTGLPEVVASVVSSIRGRSDVAIGNVIGSNLFNILVILGFSGLVSPLTVPEGIINSDGWWMLAVTILLFPVMLTRLQVDRWEGAALVGIYSYYIAGLVGVV